MLVLGIDPGTATTGYGVIDVPDNTDLITFKKFGCIMTPKEAEMPARLLTLRDQLAQLITIYKPDCIAVEKLFFGVNARSAMSVGQARGVVMVTAEERRVPIFEYQGLVVKLKLTGYGRAAKSDIQKAVLNYLGKKELPKPTDQNGKSAWSFRDDAYDAVAIAIYHAIALKETDAKEEKRVQKK